MAEQTTVLQLVLDQLQMGNSISTMDERIAIQKVVCLTQEAGLQLGYSFNWYVRGPYSPVLAADYYQIAGARDTVEHDAQRFTLTEAAQSAVNKVATVLNAPAGVMLQRVHWLELLASIVFLNRRYRLSLDATRQKIQMSKAGLYPYFDQAVDSLRNAGFTVE